MVRVARVGAAVGRTRSWVSPSRTARRDARDSVVHRPLTRKSVEGDGPPYCAGACSRTPAGQRACPDPAAGGRQAAARVNRRDLELLAAVDGGRS